MATAKQLLRQIPKAERDLLIFEMRRQKSYWLFKALMNTDKLKTVGQLIRSIDFYKTEHGFDFWCKILHREMCPKWARKDLGHDY